MGTTHFSGLNLKVGTFADEAAGDHTVTGITTDDVILAVVGFTIALGEGTPNTAEFTALNITDEFSIKGDDTVNNATGTNLTDSFAICIWLDKDAA